MGQSSFEARMAMWEEMLKSNITPTIASAEEVLKVADGNMALRVINYLLSLPPQAKGVKISEESSLHKRPT